MKPPTSPHPKKSQSPFQQLINSSVAKIREFYPQAELHEFNQLLNQQQPKKIKQLNIDPYMFLLDYLLDKEELVYFGLKQLNVIIDENYCSKSSLTLIARLLAKVLEKHSTQVINIVLKIKEPNIYIFQLFFQIYSTILMPQDVALKFRNLGYIWLIRIFQMKQTKIPVYFKLILDKIGVFQVPQLISHEQEERHLQTYIHKVLNNILNKVQDKIEIEMGNQALVVRKQKKGKYLYCFMCQKPADYYCKDTKVPVCGSQCKKDHLLYISEVNVVNEQFTDQFKAEIQLMLHNNWYTKRSPSVSVDYLTAIYIFSNYQPKTQIIHSKIVRSPIMVEKVWLLYGAYYEKKGQMFEHIFMSFLQSGNDYLEQLARFYFLEISVSHRILEIYYSFDLKGTIRIFPMLLKRMQADKQYCSIFITNFTEMIFQNLSSLVHHPAGNIILSSQLVQIFNESQTPINDLRKYFAPLPNFTSEQHISWFLLKNQFSLKKDKFNKILDKDEDFMKHFLKAITLKKTGSTIDQLLREIFYFINVNVSEKIYRLLQLLYDVYQFDELGDEAEKKLIKKDDALFQYMYLIIMLNTELHNPNLQKKPTLPEILQRISVINKNLSQQGQKIVEAMFQRIKSVAFNQQTRGILQRYEKCPFIFLRMDQFYLPLMILQNHEAIFQTFTSISVPNSVLYRICTILSSYPEICSMFFKMLLQRLERQQIQDDYILQAIRNIIQEQPNAVSIEGGWSIIFNYIKESDKTRRKISKNSINSPNNISESSKKIVQSTTSIEGTKRRRIFEPFNLTRSSSENGQIIVWLDLQSVLVASPLLKHDNFIFFFKDFVNTFSMDQYEKDYQKVIFLNRMRLNSMANSLMLGFRKASNLWTALNIVQFIANIQEVQLQGENSQFTEPQRSQIPQKLSKMQKMKNHIILLMFKEVLINDTTQYLLLETIISLSNSENFVFSSELWEGITHLVLKFKSEQNQSIVEDLMKRYKSCEEYYESLMIQKTLNSTQPELINKDVLTKLDKLQPYLNDLSDKILKMFILKQNLTIIIKNLDKFYLFEQTFELMLNNYQSIGNAKEVELILTSKIQNAMENQIHLESILSQCFTDFLLKTLINTNKNDDLKLTQKYCQYLAFCIADSSFNEKILLDRSIIFYQASKQIYRMAQRFQDSSKQFVLNPQLKNSLNLLIQACQKFNSNLQYRQLISQTYTFKNIIAHYQKIGHSNYLISLTKQNVECKKVVWHLVKRNETQKTIFLVDFLKLLSNQYVCISKDLINIQKSTSSNGHQTLSSKKKHLREKVFEFRSYFEFLLSVLTELDIQPLSEKQQTSEESKTLQQILRQLFVQILFNGIFKVQQNRNNHDKKPFHEQLIINTEPFSEYLQTIGKSQGNMKKMIENIIFDSK